MQPKRAARISSDAARSAGAVDVDAVCNAGRAFHVSTPISRESCAGFVYFIPVPAMPVVMYFCRNRKTTVTGSRLRKVIARI